jgi:hypothetical protein
MSRFDLTMSVLTLAGVIIAALTGAIFWHQLESMETDERAWINITAKGLNFTPDKATGNIALSVPVTIKNTGKTPAKIVRTEIVINKVFGKPGKPGDRRDVP